MNTDYVFLHLFCAVFAGMLIFTSTSSVLRTLFRRKVKPTYEDVYNTRLGMMALISSGLFILLTLMELLNIHYYAPTGHDIPIFVVWAFVIFFAVPLGYIAKWRLRAKRRIAFRQLAKRNEWEFVGATHEIADIWSDDGIKFFEPGDGRKLTSVIIDKSQQFPVTAFDYRMYTMEKQGDVTRRVWHYWYIVTVESQQFNFPSFDVINRAKLRGMPFRRPVRDRQTWQLNDEIDNSLFKQRYQLRDSNVLTRDQRPFISDELFAWASEQQAQAIDPISNLMTNEVINWFVKQEGDYDVYVTPTVIFIACEAPFAPEDCLAIMPMAEDLAVLLHAANTPDEAQSVDRTVTISAADL